MESLLPIALLCVCLALGGVIAFRRWRELKQIHHEPSDATPTTKAQQRNQDQRVEPVAFDPISGEQLVDPVPLTIHTRRVAGKRRGSITFMVNRRTWVTYAARNGHCALAALLSSGARLHCLNESDLIRMGTADDGVLVNFAILFHLASGTAPEYEGPGFVPGGDTMSGAGAYSGRSDDDDRTVEPDRAEQVSVLKPTADRDYSAPDTRTADTGGHQSNDHDFGAGRTDDSD